MTVQLKLKTDFNTDAQRQGHVGFDVDKIYEVVPGEDVDRELNGDRSLKIFSLVDRQEYSDLSAKEVAMRMITERLSNNPGSGNYNPDFTPEEAVNSYSYNKEITSASKERSSDLNNRSGDEDEGVQRFAPNVVFPNNEEAPYQAPFKSELSKGGFGNSAEEGSLHTRGELGTEGELDSIEVLSKYQ